LREKPGIPEDSLWTCLQDQYGLVAVTLDFLPLGLDTRAGVYRVVDEQGIAYFLKAKADPLYEPSCLIPGYLRDRGIGSVVAPLPTRSNTLWARIGEWTVILYPFIEGDSDWDPGLTAAHWQALGTALKEIHQVGLPTEGIGLPRRETFDPKEYIRWVREFEAPGAHSQGGGSIQQEFHACWIEQRTTIHAALTAMDTLATVLQKQSGPYVICHADLHPGNIIRDHADRVFVIDWDDVMLAPKERDFLFVGAAPSAGSAREAIPPFFQGYGETEIDRVALTYYLWERVVTDVIACAKDVIFRDDLEEKTKVEMVQLFRDVLKDGGEVDAARSAAAHLPSPLTVNRALS
jgi:spectinomycin phosphotransferase